MSNNKYDSIDWTVAEIMDETMFYKWWEWQQDTGGWVCNYETNLIDWVSRLYAVKYAAVLIEERS